MEIYYMKNLLRLMEEFSILGMDKPPIGNDSGLEFPPMDVNGEAPVEEYELGPDGQPLLDEQGNPIKKLAATADKCGCPSEVSPAEVPAGEPPASPLPPPDEFDFKI
jgi:hypothetical protein